jgi:hypothetical protein
MAEPDPGFGTSRPRLHPAGALREPIDSMQSTRESVGLDARTDDAGRRDPIVMRRDPCARVAA